MKIRSIPLRCGALLLVGAGMLAPLFWLAYRNQQTSLPDPQRFACCQRQEVSPSAVSPSSGADSELRELPPHQLVLWQREVPEPAFAAFQQWAGRPGDEKTAMLAEGVQLATTRRAALAALIVADPARALELAVPETVRRQLPAEVADLLEDRIDARSMLRVTARSGYHPLPDDDGITRDAIIDGKTFAAHVYGRRAWQLYTALHLMVQRDDGIRVFLNGVPVVTNNLPAAAALWHFALTEISPADFFQWHHFLIDATSLLPGPDLGFSLQLSAALKDGPPNLTIRPKGADRELRWPAAYSAWQLQTSTTMQNDWTPVPVPILLRWCFITGFIASNRRRQRIAAMT